MRSLVAPELIVLLDIFPALDLSAAGLAGTRALVAQVLQAISVREGPSRELQVRGAPGAPNVRLLACEPREAAALRPAILFLHGGGMVMGTADQSNAALWHMANELGAVVVSVDYRLAPGTPFPGPLEDCHAALCGLVSVAGLLGIDPGRVVVMGESAGGGSPLRWPCWCVTAAGRPSPPRC